MKVIGVDPGTRIVGYGILEKNGNSISYIDSGNIQTKRVESLPERLKVIYNRLTEVVLEHKPDILAVEKAFYGKNIQSAIRIGESRGVILLVAAMASLPVAEYDATRIKKSVVGLGNANKSQVQYMVKKILSLDKKMGADESDALAIAICYCQQFHSKQYIL